MGSKKKLIAPIPNLPNSSITQTKEKRGQLSQTEVPSYTLEQALRVPQAIIENYAAKPSGTFDVARALDLLPASSSFRMLTGASIAYGLTDGGAYAEQISLTDLGKKACSETVAEALIAKRQAFLKPRIIREFLVKYDSSPLPVKNEIAQDQLKGLGVPQDKTQKVYELIIDGAKSLGLITDYKGKRYVRLNATPDALDNAEVLQDEEAPEVISEAKAFQDNSKGNRSASTQNNQSDTINLTRKRVFITHGKNRAFLEPIKRFLEFGEMEPVVSVEKQTISEPVPDKVMNEMRSCGAAIIHVDEDQKLIDHDGNVSVVLNANVLIEIGAAMALYGRRFILLVKDGITLPSNLQGLFEVRYKGDTLDSDATMRLLDAIKVMKSHA